MSRISYHTDVSLFVALNPCPLCEDRNTTLEHALRHVATCHGYIPGSGPIDLCPCGDCEVCLRGEQAFSEPEAFTLMVEHLAAYPDPAAHLMETVIVEAATQ